MASLENKKIKDTYEGLIKTNDNSAIDGAVEITDGAGNGTGVSISNDGQVTATGTVSFGSLKDTGEDITITKFVDQADGIDGNDNDTTIPTSAAVKDYVDTKVTAEDLDFSGDSGTGSIDLDTEVLSITGSGIATTSVPTDNNLQIDVPATNLSNTPSASTLDVESSTGTNTTLPSATTSLAGVMSSADKTKLDGIETGAEVNTVDSVNTQTGAVVLDADDISDATTTNKWATSAEKTKLGHISVTQAVDLDTIESNVATNNAKNSYPSADATKVGFISVTQAVDLDTMESNIATNNAKVSNVTTNLSATADGTSLTINSSDGTNASVPAATTSAWGAMTDEDKTKLDGIASGAEVNVQSDWDATSGDALILNKPTLGTAAASAATDFVAVTGDTMTGDLTMGTNSIFIGGTGAGNEFDDYEVGTYNPTFYYFASPFDNGNIGQSDASYWLNASKYTKIGDTVIISIDLQFGFGTTNYPSSGTIYLDNLPFTPINMLQVQGSWSAASLDSTYTANINGNLGGSGVYNTQKVGFVKSLTTTIGSSIHPDTFVYGDGTSLPNVAKLYGHIIYKTNS